MKQMLLFPDARPLVDKLGPSFFRSLPERPGVYLMRDAADAVLYVGKAKNLRKRLGSYRVANPDRLPRRHLRLLRAVARIELQECPDEASALARETELLRALKPKFNRAGTWPATPRFLVWRQIEETLELAVTEQTEAGWEAVGPMGIAAWLLRNSLARLLWCALHPADGPLRWPCGWLEGRLESVVRIAAASLCEEAAGLLREMFSRQRAVYCAAAGSSVAGGRNPDSVLPTDSQPVFFEWVRARQAADLHPFSKTAIEADLEVLTEFVRAKRS